jgi:hypothetical protein
MSWRKGRDRDPWQVKEPHRTLNMITVRIFSLMHQIGSVTPIESQILGPE